MSDNAGSAPEKQDIISAEAKRNKIIVRTSIIGIVANIFLAAFKAGVGLLANSIAIVLDAVNNLSDALSSIITIIGTRIAGKEPDRKHPYGHGRVEYITTIIIGVIIVSAGAASLQESVSQIISPQTPSYNTISLVIVAVAVVVKIVLGLYVKEKGSQANSGTLVASGQDALMDSIISASTLVAALIYIFAGISLEAWLAAIISLVIIKAGVDILREAISKILGERVDSEISKAVKETVNSFPEVHGAYDLVLNDYGPQRMHGSVHVEVDDTMTAVQIAELTRRIQGTVYQEHHVLLEAVGIYSKNTGSGTAAKMYDEISKMVWSHETVREIHGFYVDEETKRGTFDIVISYDEGNRAERREIYDDIVQHVEDMYPDYHFDIIMDADITD